MLLQNIQIGTLSTSDPDSYLRDEKLFEWNNVNTETVMVDKRIKCEDEKGIKDFATVHRRYHFNQIWFMNWEYFVVSISFKFYAKNKMTWKKIKNQK